MKKLKTKRIAKVDAPIKLIWKSTIAFQSPLDLDEAVNRLMGISHFNGEFALDTRLDNLKQLNSVILLLRTTPYPIGRWLITTLRETSSGPLEVESTGGFDALSFFPSLLITVVIGNTVVFIWPSLINLLIMFIAFLGIILSIFVLRYWVRHDIRHLHHQLETSLFTKEDWVRIAYGGFKQI